MITKTILCATFNLLRDNRFDLKKVFPGYVPFQKGLHVHPFWASQTDKGTWVDVADSHLGREGEEDVLFVYAFCDNNIKKQNIDSHIVRAKMNGWDIAMQ